MRGANEAKVGFVVVLALLMLGGGYFFLRGLGLGADVYYMRLDKAANIAAGSDVRLQGVKVGQVQEVTLDPATQKPLLTLAIKSNKPAYRLAQNYKYVVRSGSLIGENYVDIRGTFDASKPLYVANDPNVIIAGGAAGEITEVTDQVAVLGKDFQVTLQKLNITIDRINKGVLSYDNQIKLARTLDGVAKLTQRAGQGFGPDGVRVTLGDQRAQNSLNRTLSNTANASEQANLAMRNINGLTRELGGVVQENRGQIRGLLGNMSSAASNVSGLTASLNFIVREGGLKENSTIAFRSLRRAAENVEAGTAGFKAIAGDPTTQKDLKDTLVALRIATEALRDTAVTVKSAISDTDTQRQLKTTLGVLSETAVSLRTTMANLAEASTGVKNIVGDASLQANVKASAENLAGTLAATRAAAERVNALLGGRRPGSVPAGGATGESTAEKALLSDLPAGVDFSYRRFTDFDGAARTGNDVSGKNYGDLTFNAEFFGSPFRLGLANIGSGTDLTLQSGRFLGRDAAVRYGLYRSKLGVGAQVQKGRLSFEGNLWDPNNRSLNAYLGYRITPQLEVLAGRENIRGVRANSIGVRLRP